MPGQDANEMAAMLPPPPPAPTTGVLSSIPNGFRTQFEAILESTKQALKHNSRVVAVDIYESAGQWGRGMSMVVYTRREDAYPKERDAHFKTSKASIEEIRKIATGALLKGAEHSKGVYVMGYKDKPFTHSQNGFNATLGGMFDSTKACWDMFSKGCCNREWDCRWQHPACTLPIQMEVRRSHDS